MRSLQFFIIIVCSAVTAGLFGQNDEFVAHRKFETGDYDAAIQTYRQILEENPENETAMIRIAESLRMKGQLSEAVEWYGKVADMDRPAKAFIFNFAKSLQELGYYQRAKNWFLKYAEIDPVKGMHYALSCEYALQEDLRSDNSVKLDIAYKGEHNYRWPSLIDNRLVMWTDDPEVAHYTNAGNWFSGEIRGWKEGWDLTSFEMINKLDEKSGPFSIHSEKNRVAVSIVNNGGERTANHDEYNIMIGTRDKQSEAFKYVAFPFNATGYSTGYPYWSSDDGALYFSSNRPGGFGGYDLYVCYFEDGQWTYPQNMGERINSPGNEIAPVFKDGTIYFSSDWHNGFGGYDIFKSEMNGFNFSTPENMGKPINSSRNEWGLNFDDTYTYAFFTSDRNRPGFTDLMHLQYVHESAEVMANNNVPTKVDPVSLLPLRKNELIYDQDNEISFAQFTSMPVERENNSTVETGESKSASLQVEDQQSTGFFIQVAALSRSKGSLSQFRPLAKFGNIYRVESNGLYKIRLGIYNTMGSAVEKLRQVKASGYSDAYIVQEPINTSALDLIITREGPGEKSTATTTTKKAEKIKPQVTTNVVSEKVYKVRLTAYHYNTQFDTRDVSDLGEIEQWTKGTWKIILLGGYKTVKEAKTALSKARVRGYKDAYLVVEEDGLLLPYEE